MSVDEQMFWNKNEGAIARPFSIAVNVSCRARSLLLQRALVDFGAEESFSNAVKRINEHYGVDVASSTTRLDVEKHAQAVHEQIDNKILSTVNKSEASDIVGQIDGCMVPVVTPKCEVDSNSDQRKNKNHEWKEARLALARPKGSVDSVYAATLGSIDDAGAKLETVVKASGDGEKTKIHCVGDGAPWIAEQVDKLFGTKATFLLDFFHASEYLAQAATCCNPDAPHTWRHEQQALLKNSQAHDVLKNIQDHLQICTLKESCPALKCFNYLSRRLNQLDYKRAIESDLPIGSGEIESAHRSVIQKRLKIAGAWWTVNNAQNILDLRTIRANGLWDKYWTGFKSSGAACAYG